MAGRMRLHWLLVGCLSCSMYATAAAQEGRPPQADIDRARELFNEGVTQSRDGNWSGARESFERSYAAAPAAVTLLNLAGAEAELGQLVRARSTYRRFLEQASDAQRQRFQAQVEQALEDLDRRVGRLSIDLRQSRPGDVVALDGDVVEAIDGPVLVDPGEHSVEVRRNGAVAARASVRVAEGETQTATLRPVSVEAPRPEPVEPEPVLSREDAEPEEERSRTGLWIGVSVGAVLVVAAIAAIAVNAASKEEEPFMGNFGDGVVRVP